MQSNPQIADTETENRATTEQAQTDNHGGDEHGYDDGLVHSHGWASSSYDR